MTVVSFKNRVNGRPVFNNSLSDFFAPIPSFHRSDVHNGIPVNISESEAGFVLELIAPGFEKDDFALTVDKNLMTVSATLKTETKKNEKNLRTEYRISNFKRSFSIENDIDAEKISAQYLNGILTLNLPRKVEVKAEVKKIDVQ